MFKQLGSIIVADDQLINLEVLKNTLREIGVKEKASYYVNGQEAIDAAKRMIEFHLRNSDSSN